MSRRRGSGVRLIDIAERAGVSPMAVARVLNGLSAGEEIVRLSESSLFDFGAD